MDLIETIISLIVPALIIYISITIPRDIRKHYEYTEKALEIIIKKENELKDEITKLKDKSEENSEDDPKQ